MADFKVGALCRSSSFAIRAILKFVREDDAFVVEYGAGDGIITKEILKKLPADGKLVAIETNEHFFKELLSISDPRLTVIHGDVFDVSQKLGELPIPRIDVVISGIPFSFMTSESRRKIIEATSNGLRPGGRFIVYQFSQLVLAHLKHYFEKVYLRFEPRNIFPYLIMVGEKRKQ